MKFYKKILKKFDRTSALIESRRNAIKIAKERKSFIASIIMHVIVARLEYTHLLSHICNECRHGYCITADSERSVHFSR